MFPLGIECNEQSILPECSEGKYYRERKNRFRMYPTSPSVRGEKSVLEQNAYVLFPMLKLNYLPRIMDTHKKGFGDTVPSPILSQCSYHELYVSMCERSSHPLG